MLALADVRMDVDLHVNYYVAVYEDVNVTGWTHDERLVSSMHVLRRLCASFVIPGDEPSHADRVRQLTEELARERAGRASDYA